MFAQMTTLSKAENNVCNPPKRVSNFTADVIIGGLIPVHAGRESNLNEPGVMWVEAMMYAIKEINDNKSLLPDITLGFDIRDSCNKADLALGAALDFMLKPTDKGDYIKFDNKSESSCFCNKNANRSSIPPVLAVVGGASSRISTTVSTLFSADNIPQISYSSTSPTLSNKNIYRTFFRTIPSDLHQAKAIADILGHFNWTYVSIVASDDEYGRNGLIALGKILKIRHFCIAEEALFSTRRDAGHIIRRLQEDTRQRVVVLWCERPAAIEFFEAATGNLSNITWIGTESWGDNKRVKDEIDFELIGGMLGVVPYLGRHDKFDKHLKSLTPKSKEKNPWLSEYWSKNKFVRSCVKSPGNCTDEELPNAYSLPPNKYANVMDAVYAIAYGLQSLKNSDPNLDVSALDKHMLAKLMKHIREVNFHPLSAKGKFNFTEYGDPNFGAYLIKNLQGNTTNKEFVTVAQWNGETSKLEFEDNVKIQWNHGGNSVPLSRCSEICEAGFGFVRSSKECCWSCPKCQAGYYKPNVGKLCFHYHLHNESNIFVLVQLLQNLL